jgi:hypothetical protein
MEGFKFRGRAERCLTSDKTHVEHKESALTLIADIPGDMNFRCNGPNTDFATVGMRTQGGMDKFSLGRRERP